MKKLLLIPALCLMFFSCNPNSGGSVRIAQSEDQSNPKDWEITLKVKEVILADTSLSLGNRFVSVNTTDGVVTLTGNVSTQSQIDEIVNMVENIDGVDSVNNQLMVSKN